MLLCHEILLPPHIECAASPMPTCWILPLALYSLLLPAIEKLAKAQGFSLVWSAIT
jgi:hypothetical protein